MPGRFLAGLDEHKHVTVVTELGIRWAKRRGAMLVGLAVVDEPGIRAVEPTWPVGGTPGVDPVYYMGYEARLATVHRQADQSLTEFAALCDSAGVSHAEVKAIGSPEKVIADEAQSCDLVLVARGAHFGFSARDDAAEQGLQKVLRYNARPIVVVPATPFPDGPIVVGYDGSLQAARALAAFQATGLRESREVHVVSVDASASTAAQHAERARIVSGTP